jgi:Ser/Thr protein kinase RdoA (MazF antagonist)
MTQQHPYESLTPDLVLDAVESTGLISDLRILALNSYENRVYQVGIESSQPIIVKFYRPERWTNEQILEEHQYTLALKDLDISVVAPMINEAGETLHHFDQFRFALYERQGGHAPNLDNLDTLLSLGRTLGRMHALGKEKIFTHRLDINLDTFGHQSVEFVLQNRFIPDSLKNAYTSLTADLLKICAEQMRMPYQKIRLHGDCHPGNILWRHDTAHFVDFDDARNGPAIQDLWMLLSGERQQQIEQLSEILEGYNEFCDFNLRELPLIESLRSLRIIHYSAWLARRWQDPAFPKFFPWFNTERYWGEHILQLREQLAAIHEPPLVIY